MRVALIPIAAVTLAAAPAPAVPAGVMAAMDDSAAGWNAGDLDRFMRVYAGDATYVTPKGLVKGRAAIADHYRASFAKGGNRRGRLSFEALGSRMMDPSHTLLFARWVLTPAMGKRETGMTTLLFERRREGWRIVADHSN